jgi:hypothetical protein
MSPELLCLEKFGLKLSRPTKSSDCYALGMVIYEVLSGQVPFSCHGGYTVVVKVLEGQRPRWPQGMEGTYDNIQEVLARCWKSKPEDRPRIEDVLRCLEDVSEFWVPLPPWTTASPSILNSPTRSSSGLNIEGSTEGSEASSPSRSSSMLPPKGKADDRIPILALPDAFKVSHYGVTHNQDLVTHGILCVKDLSQSDPRELVADLDRVGERDFSMADFSNSLSAH